MKKALIAACLALLALASACAPAAPGVADLPGEPGGLHALDEGLVARPAAVLGAGASSLVEPPPTAVPSVALVRPARPLRVVASWYGEQFYGRQTACGQTYSGALLGVAHRTLPCGASVSLRYGSAQVTVPVVDRGPFRAGREFDLTYATRVALGCPDLCRLTWLR